MKDSTYKRSFENLPELGRNIREWRKSKGLTQSQLEQRAGLSHNAISRIEKGIVKNPRLDNLEKIAAVLELSVDQLHLKTPAYRLIDPAAEYDTGALIERLEALPSSKRNAVAAAFYSLLEQIESDDD